MPWNKVCHDSSWLTEAVTFGYGASLSDSPQLRPDPQIKHSSNAKIAAANSLVAMFPGPKTG